MEAVEATAAREGNIEYYYCKICYAAFLDEDALQQIDREAVVLDKLAPDMIDGDKSVVDISSGKSAMFRSNAAIDDFIRAELDGKELTVDKDYTVKEGSIIVTLLPSYISRLSTGSHKLGIVSLSGTATANFTVTKSQEPTSSEEETTTKSEPESSQSPTEGTQEPTSSQSPTGGAQEPISSQNPTSDGTEPAGTDEPESPSSGGYLSPSTGSGAQVKAWVIVGGLLVSAFAFMRKRK